MQRLGPVLRMSLGLVVLTSSVLVLVDLAGLVPSGRNPALQSRIRLSETLATQLMPAAEQSDFASIRRVLEVTVTRNKDVVSAGLRAPNGRILVAVGDHHRRWNPDHATRSSATHVRLPLFQSGREWANVELRFESIGSSNWLIALWKHPLFRLIVSVAVLGFGAYLVYMKRMLRHLDPSAVIPARVQNALDVMSEGVLLLDEQERIVLANTAFAGYMNRTPASLLGIKASELDWKPPDAAAGPLPYPWRDAIRNGQTSKGTLLRIETEPGAPRSFALNASPVLDGWDKPKGAIVTLDDVTELEEKTALLEAANVELEKSRNEIRLHAEEMEVLARRDPLTGVANRRAFMEWAENELRASLSEGSRFSLLMCDIDHFKLINDTHGHPMGDEVIRRIAELFSNEVREADSICRYGGEEFCIAFPGSAIEVAIRVAERLRKKIAAPSFTRVPVTMSFGVVSSETGATTLSEMMEQADKALYVSKEGGRNRVSNWDDVGAET